MNSFQIEKNIQHIAENFSKEEFVFDLLLAYGIPKSNVTILKKDPHALSKKENQIILKKKLFFHEAQADEDLHAVIDTLKKDSRTMRHAPRFIVATDYVTLLAVDTKTNDHLDILLKGIAKHYDFFLPWAGIEKHKHKNENPADRKAAEKMAKLYDIILDENDIHDQQRTHDLNVFLARLLFCFFAEDTNIFPQGIFTDSVASHTKADGEDLDEYLGKLFTVLNTKEEHRAHDLPHHFRKFPYVNGGLFKETHWIPKFSAKSHRIIIECGELDWKLINPDIFGSMMQAVTHPGQRASLGMHYTSVPNIMKVIEPLFLNDLKEVFEKSKGNKKKLNNLLNRIARIKLFDPACGSGNFLIIAYKELRRLQMAILQEMNSTAYPRINLSQFYGIEIDDFAHTIAKLSLYLAEHQMNMEFKSIFGRVEPTLPLKESGHIVCGNATRLDWEAVCPKRDGDEIYVLGNPPYLGAAFQSRDQQEDRVVVCQSLLGSYKKLDYIACWFVLAGSYIKKTNASVAFVSTNSICQGEQTALLWPYIFKQGICIFFTHQSFKWENNAKGNAGVTVVIIGIKNKEDASERILFSGGSFRRVLSINAYLTEGSEITVEKRFSTLTSLPEIVRGSIPYDDGNLMLTDLEKNNLIDQYPSSQTFIRSVKGSAEFIRGIDRWCLWITEDMIDAAYQIEPIKNRIENVKRFRISSNRIAMNDLAKYPYRFGDIRHKEKYSIIIPRVSSERRIYMPIGFLDPSVIVLDSAYAIYDAEPWIFGVISSRMHMTWVRAVAGRLKTDYRYSSALCYNTFPIPNLTTKQKEELTRHTYTILEEREKHPEKTIAQLYDPDKMPQGLKEAHHSLDQAVERIYRSKPFTSDEERLEHLFDLYSKMINTKE